MRIERLARLSIILYTMKLPSLFTSLSRHFKQRELNRTHERLAELDASIAHYDRFSSPGSNGERKPAELVERLGKWRGENAKLLVRRDRLEKELGVVKSGE